MLLQRIGISMSTVGIMLFYSHFGGQEYSAKLNKVPGHTLHITSHSDLDNMRPSYQTLFKEIRLPQDGYMEPVKIQNYLSFLVFLHYSVPSSTLLRNMKRNLGRRSVERKCGS